MYVKGFVEKMCVNWLVDPRVFCLASAGIVSRACVLRASPRGMFLFCVRLRVATLFYLVKCLLFAIIVSAVFITGVVAADLTLVSH